MRIIYLDNECEVYVKIEKDTHCVLTFKPAESIPLTDSMVSKLREDDRVRVEG